jgi:hypothetical protein
MTIEELERELDSFETIAADKVCQHLLKGDLCDTIGQLVTGDEDDIVDGRICPYANYNWELATNEEVGCLQYISK